VKPVPLQGKQLLKLGLAFAMVPAALFFPAVAALTVCPPSYGPALMTTLAIGFICSWSFAIVLLSKARMLSHDDLAVLAFLWVGIAISALGISFTIWAFARSFMHRP
jgi:hypothetical protein